MARPQYDAVDQITIQCLRPLRASTLLSSSTPSGGSCGGPGSLPLLATLFQVTAQSCWARAGAGHTEDAQRAGGVLCNGLVQVISSLQCSNAGLSRQHVLVSSCLCRCCEFLKTAWQIASPVPPVKDDCSDDKERCAAIDDCSSDKERLLVCCHQAQPCSKVLGGTPSPSN